MKVRYGNHSVEWDGDFKFGVATHNDFELEQVAPARAVGAAFLSGLRTCPVVHADMDGECSYFNVSGPCVLPSKGNLPRIPKNMSWVLCGPGVEDSQLVSSLCRRATGNTVYVSPISGPLAAFGYLVGALTIEGKVKPRMTRFCEPRCDSMDLECQKYDHRLEGDGFGRMAHLIQARTPVINQMMRTPSISAFYGRILSTDRWWGEPIFLMLADTARKYFPTESLSLRNYAATWVPVSVKNTDEFAKTSGCGQQDVRIFVASEQTPGLGTFLRFHQIMGKEDFVVSSDPKTISAIPDTIPLFRWNGAYNIGKDLFLEVVR